MSINEKTNKIFIKVVLSFASKRKLNKLDIIGLLERTKLMVYNTDFNEV